MLPLKENLFLALYNTVSFQALSNLLYDFFFPHLDISLYDLIDWLFLFSLQYKLHESRDWVLSTPTSWHLWSSAWYRTDTQ